LCRCIHPNASLGDRSGGGEGSTDDQPAGGLQSARCDSPGFYQERCGGICLVSSVDGYTGLPKALAYGPGKAALIDLAQILYTDLSPRGTGVYLVNPGFVATRLTRQNEFKMPALITAGVAAEAILAGIGKGQFEILFPKRFTGWMKWFGRMPDRIRFYLLAKVVHS